MTPFSGGGGGGGINFVTCWMQFNYVAAGNLLVGDSIEDVDESTRVHDHGDAMSGDVYGDSSVVWADLRDLRW